MVFCYRRAPFAQALAGEFDPISVVDDTVEDGVGNCRYADQVVPAINGNLAGDDEGAGVVAVLDNFQEIARLVGIERFGPPVVEDQQFGAGDRAQQPAVTSVAMSDREVGKEPRHAVIEDRDVLPASFLAERAGEPALAEPARPGDQQIAALSEPVAGGEFEKERAVEPALALVIHVFDAGRMTQTRGARARFEAFLSPQRRFVFEQQAEPFGVLQAARLGLVFEFLEPLGEPVKAKRVQLIERRMASTATTSPSVFGPIFAAHRRKRSGVQAA